MAVHQPLLSFQTLPAKTRSRLSLVGHRKQDLQAWLGNLPMINAAESGKLLHQTLRELTELDIDADARFELLEILEPSLHTLADMLAKHSRIQSVLSSVQAQRVATFTQSLHAQLAQNYKIVAIETLRKLKGRVGLFDLGRNAGRLQAATAIQRAIHQLGGQLLDAALAYAPPPPGAWAELHGLFQEAMTQTMTDQAVSDKSGRHGTAATIRRSYLRAVFMATCQLHKLRQSDILLLHTHSERWAELLTLNDRAADCLLVCNPGDMPPGYRHRLQATSASWHIDSRALVTHLRTLGTHTPELSPGLVVHLLDVWRHPRERMFARRACDHVLQVCLGLSATHYFMSGEQDFARIVEAAPLSQDVAQPAFLFALEEGNTAAAGSSDDWMLEARVDLADQEPALPETGSRLFTTHRVQAVNHSPAGYGVRWPERPPQDSRPGEIIGIRREHSPDWLVGMMHWTRQEPGAAAEAGLEVLSTQAKACAICLCERQRNTSQYLRGMLIPAMPSLERPATLIAPTSFTTGNDIRICLRGNNIQARLTRLVLATPSIGQFEFALLADGPGTPPPPSADSDDLDAMWAQL